MSLRQEVRSAPVSPDEFNGEIVRQAPVLAVSAVDLYQFLAAELVERRQRAARGETLLYGWRRAAFQNTRSVWRSDGWHGVRALWQAFSVRRRASEQEKTLLIEDLPGLVGVYLADRHARTLRARVRRAVRSLSNAYWTVRRRLGYPQHIVGTGSLAAGTAHDDARLKG